MAAGEADDTTPGERARALRRAVLALEGCLAGLPAAEREVLELRAGLGIDRPRSRRSVAELTDLEPAEVKRLERSGLRHLRALHEAGCGVASAQGADARASGVLATTASGPGAGAVLGESERSSGQPPAAGNDDASPTRRTPLAKAADGGSKAVPDLSLILIPIVVLGFLMFAARELRRTLNRA